MTSPANGSELPTWNSKYGYMESPFLTPYNFRQLSWRSLTLTLVSVAERNGRWLEEGEKRNWGEWVQLFLDEWPLRKVETKPEQILQGGGSELLVLQRTMLNIPLHERWQLEYPRYPASAGASLETHPRRRTTGTLGEELAVGFGLLEKSSALQQHLWAEELSLFVEEQMLGVLPQPLLTMPPQHT